MNLHSQFMKRCFDLARLAAGKVAPNPMVGAVLVFQNRVIGEGFHRQYGQAHAEVNAIGSVRTADRHLVQKSTLYVSLEPCCFRGNTPACTSLIIEKKIPKVVISCLDNTREVSGKGIEMLRDAGIEVLTGILEDEGKWLSRFRTSYVLSKRPYVMLKFAKSKDGFMGFAKEQVWISNSYSKRWVHKCRSEVDAILVGTNTALIDDPELTTRLYFGRSPLRIILDCQLRLPNKLKIFDGSVKTWIVNAKKESLEKEGNLRYIKLPFSKNLLPKLLNRLFQAQISSLIVEGGRTTLQAFLSAGLWDEARVFTAEKLLGGEIMAPDIPSKVFDEFKIGDDQLTIYRKSAHIR